MTEYNHKRLSSSLKDIQPTHPNAALKEAAPSKACIADLIHMALTHMLCNISEQLGQPV